MACRRRVVVTIMLQLLMLAALPAAADSPSCAKLRDLKSKTYGFHPARLTDKERSQKSKAMDAFWDEAKKSRDSTCLVTLLQNEPDGEFFLFDGASLLVKLSPTRTSADVAVAAIQRADLEDIDVAGYISLVLRLRQLEADTGPLAVKLLTAPEVSGFVAVHALRIDRNVAGMFLFGSLSTDQNDKYLLPLLASENKAVRNTAIYLATASMTAASFAALRDVDKAGLPESLVRAVDSVLVKRVESIAREPKHAREEVLRALASYPNDESAFEGSGAEEMMFSAVLTLTPADVEAVRSARWRSFRGVSDESLYRFYGMTNLLITMINRMDLYAEYRRPSQQPK